MQVQIVNKSMNELPDYAKLGDSGMDVRANFSNGLNEDFMFGAAFDDIRKTLIIFSGGRCLVPTGLYTSITPGYEIQVRSRSGLALKSGVFVTNGIGTIDAGYRSEIGVILTNLGSEPFEIVQGDRIAQLVLVKVEHAEWNVVETLDESDRGETGFGASGIK